MLSQIIADFLVLLHLSFIVFVVFGGLLLTKYRWLIVLHFPAVVWGVLLEFRGWYCPLTNWENHFRRAADQAGYSSGFIEHYIIPLIYPAGLTADTQTLFGILAILANLLIYSYQARSLFKMTSRSFSEK